LPLPTAGSRERAATPQEAAELLEPLEELERGLWATAFYAGLRRGELRALRRHDIDVDAATITVERGWDDKEGPIEPKSRAGKRTVFLVDALRPVLEPLAIRPGNPDGLLFGLMFETAFEPKNIARKAQARGRRQTTEARDEIALLEPITLHEARRSFQRSSTTWCVRGPGRPVRVTRRIGGRALPAPVAGRIARTGKLLDPTCPERAPATLCRSRSRSRAAQSHPGVRRGTAALVDSRQRSQQIAYLIFRNGSSATCGLHAQVRRHPDERIAERVARVQDPLRRPPAW
jgi:hypothetical protein